jgi:hypothetical protein
MQKKELIILIRHATEEFVWVLFFFSCISISTIQTKQKQNINHKTKVLINEITGISETKI